MLRTGRSVHRIPAWARDFSLLQNVQTGSRAHPASCSTGAVSRGFSGRNVMLATYPKEWVDLNIPHRLICLNGTSPKCRHHYPSFSWKDKFGSCCVKWPTNAINRTRWGAGDLQQRLTKRNHVSCPSSRPCAATMSIMLLSRYYRFPSATYRSSRDYRCECTYPRN